MPISRYLKELRAYVGSQLILIPGVAAVIRDETGRVLLHSRSDEEWWSLPAGAIEPGESPADAVVREVGEETGLEVVPERILGVFGGSGFRHVYPNGDAVEYTVVVFECRVNGGRLHPFDGEALELRYFDPEEMPGLALSYPSELFRSPGPNVPLF
jgi:8-oxo-dGTP pyrophosphatase MutT (NUDIX family)